MAYTKGKTEHTGAKNGGGGMWGQREFVKQASRKRRRRADRVAVAPYQLIRETMTPDSRKRARDRTEKILKRGQAR